MLTARGNLSPTNGGCWFCHKDGLEMHFSGEFDTYFHMDCLKHQIKRGLDPETAVFAKEFGLIEEGSQDDSDDYNPNSVEPTEEQLRDYEDHLERTHPKYDEEGKSGNMRMIKGYLSPTHNSLAE